MRKRRPQITGYFKDDKGARLYKAVDMGFGDPHWAKIKSEAIIDTLIQVIPLAWRIVKIDYQQETAFTKSLERVCNKLGSKARYLVIRTQPEGEDSTYSWFFIHNLKTGIKELEKYIIEDSLISSAIEIRATLENLFSVKLHPQQIESKKAKRFSISAALRPDLEHLRMETLIKKAKEGKNHVLVDGTKQTTDFETRLARYIKADKPLIYRLKVYDVFLILVRIRDDKKIITRNEIIRVILKLLEGRDWEKQGFFKGLPKHGAERDEKAGGFITLKGKHGALSIKVDVKTKSAWDLEDAFEEKPEVKPGEEYID
jgi:hypothetical protein